MMHTQVALYCLRLRFFTWLRPRLQEQCGTALHVMIARCVPLRLMYVFALSVWLSRLTILNKQISIVARNICFIGSDCNTVALVTWLSLLTMSGSRL
jgi:hypothetical protein